MIFAHDFMCWSAPGGSWVQLDRFARSTVRMRIMTKRENGLHPEPSEIEDVQQLIFRLPLWTDELLRGR